jgi:hypothetical protein
MNNTKWREVLKIIAVNNVHFKIAAHKPSDWDLSCSWTLDEKLIGEDHLLDPGLGGPMKYKEIKLIRIHKTLTLTERYRFKNEIQDIGFLEIEFRKLGQLPINNDGEILEIRSA